MPTETKKELLGRMLKAQKDLGGESIKEALECLENNEPLPKHFDPITRLVYQAVWNNEDENDTYNDLAHAIAMLKRSLEAI